MCKELSGTVRLHPDDIKAIAAEVVRQMKDPEDTTGVSLARQLEIKQMARQAMSQPRRAKIKAD